MYESIYDENGPSSIAFTLTAGEPVLAISFLANSHIITSQGVQYIL